MTPRCAGCDPGSDVYLPTLFGMSQDFRVRSGLICFHVWPPSTVFQRWLFAKKSDRLSTSEKTTGMVRTWRKLPVAPGPPPRPATRPGRGAGPGARLKGAPGPAAVHDVGIERVRGNVAVLVGPYGKPVAHRH